jgi:hypothetical protein
MPVKRTGAGHLIRRPRGLRTTRIIGLETQGGGGPPANAGSAPSIIWPNGREPRLITAKE